MSSKVQYWIAPGLPIAGTITPQTIIAVVCEYYKVSAEEIKSRSRKGHITLPRHMICFFMDTYLSNIHLGMVGSFVGGITHASVIYAKDKVKGYYEVDPKIRSDIDNISKKILR